MKLTELPPELISSLVDQMVVATTSANLFDGLQLRLVNHLFDQEVLRAFYRTELVDFCSEANIQRSRGMGATNVERLLVGRVAGRNDCKIAFAQELQDGIDELMRLDEMSFVKIHSVRLGPTRIRILWARESHRLQVDRLSILQAVTATVMHEFSLSDVVQLLGLEDATSPNWIRGDRGQDVICSGLSWALLTAALLGDVPTIKALLKRGSNSDRPESILNLALEIAASQGNFDAVVTFLQANVDPNGMGSCKGLLSGRPAFGRACEAGQEKIVDLLLEPRHGLKRKGPAYEEAVVMAARGRRVEDHGHIDILRSLLAKGEFADIRKIRREILGECVFWAREDVVRMVLEDLPTVRVLWRGKLPLQIAVDRGHERIAQMLIEHEAKQSK